MATNLKVFCGQFTCVASGTTQSVTAPGFQPKVVIFICSSSLKSGGGVIAPPDPISSSIEAVMGMGFSDGTKHRLVAWGGDGGVSTSASAVDADIFNCIIDATNAHQASTNSVFSPLAATIVMTATGFDVTWSSAPGAGGVLNYIALGGSDLANVAIGTGTMPTSAGNSSISGLGFQPKLVMLLSGSRTDTSALGAHFSYGCAISSSARFVHTLGVQDGQTMSSGVNGVSYQSASACLAGVTSGAALEYLADLVSMDSGGFTINFSTAPAVSHTYYYLALGGSNLNVDIATATRPTTATAQSRTGLSFKPDVAWWSNSDLTTLATITSNAVSLLGASDGTNTHSLYATHNDAINTVAGTNAVAAAAQDGVPANSSVTASFTSFNSDGWTITWGGTGAANQISSVSLAGTTVAQTFYDLPIISQPVIEKLVVVDYIC